MYADCKRTSFKWALCESIGLGWVIRLYTHAGGYASSHYQTIDPHLPRKPVAPGLCVFNGAQPEQQSLRKTICYVMFGAWLNTHTSGTHSIHVFKIKDDCWQFRRSLLMYACTPNAARRTQISASQNSSDGHSIFVFETGARLQVRARASSPVWCAHSARTHKMNRHQSICACMCKPNLKWRVNICASGFPVSVWIFNARARWCDFGRDSFLSPTQTQTHSRQTTK